MAEDQKERRDRELNELLQELRVALPGVQVLFAFLLTVPFTQRFAAVTQTQKIAYFVSLLFAATATAFLIAPSTYHRIQFRGGDKERMLLLGNYLSLTGTLFLALSMCAALFVITDLLFDGVLPGVVVVAAAAVLLGLWYGLPLQRRIGS